MNWHITTESRRYAGLLMMAALHGRGFQPVSLHGASKLEMLAEMCIVLWNCRRAAATGLGGFNFFASLISLSAEMGRS